jgi:hypothetical protein
MRKNVFHFPEVITMTVAVMMSFSQLHSQSKAPSTYLSQSPTPSLQEQLEAQYPIAKISAYRECSPGNAQAMVIQKTGACAVPGKMWASCTTKYQDGKLSSPIFGKSIARPNKHNLGILEVGDKIYPVKLEVDLSKDEVRISFRYCTEATDDQPSSAYKGDVIFVFSKGSLEKASVTQVEDTISEMFSVDSGNRRIAEQAPTQPTDNSGLPSAPISIEKGQSIDQVVAALGPPEKKVNMGTKQIFVYKDLKVTFIDGKVTDVQ